MSLRIEWEGSDVSEGRSFRIEWEGSDVFSELGHSVLNWGSSGVRFPPIGFDESEISSSRKEDTRIFEKRSSTNFG